MSFVIGRRNPRETYPQSPTSNVAVQLINRTKLTSVVIPADLVAPAPAIIAAALFTRRGSGLIEFSFTISGLASAPGAIVFAAPVISGATAISGGTLVPADPGGADLRYESAAGPVVVVGGALSTIASGATVTRSAAGGQIAATLSGLADLAVPLGGTGALTIQVSTAVNLATLSFAGWAHETP